MASMTIILLPAAIKRIEEAPEAHRCRLGMDYVKMEGRCYTHK